MALLSTVLFCVILSVSTEAFLQVSCGTGCAQSVCYATLGCRRCQLGYCLHLKSPAFCFFKCADGDYCHSLRLCTSCGVTDCKTCDRRYHCTECKSWYYLDNSSTYKSKCVSSYDCRRSRKRTSVRNGIKVCE